ncbi:cupin domain-containing protein [Bacteroidota bacterium]
MTVKNINSPERVSVPDCTKAYKQVLIEGPNFAMRRFIIEPGGSIPMHTNSVEHEQLVLRGKAEISLDGKIYNVQKDDVVFMQAGAPHYYKNTGDEPFEFLCMVPNKDDKIKFVG